MSEHMDFAVTAARILVLDDEEIQRRAIHHQLADLRGQFVDFADPREAITYLRDHAVDAVVADIRMPSLPVDGLWFLAELRQLDREVGVVLRTGDEDVAIAQAGIEARAIQRIIKAQPDSRARLRAAVKTAIIETRERRRIAAAAAEADRTRGELVSALGRMDDEITVAEMCRGFVQGLANQVTAIAGYSELLVEQTAVNDAGVGDLTRKNRAAAIRLSAQVTDFLSNPYLEVAAVDGASVNACVDALTKIFHHHSLFAAGQCTFLGRGMLPDAIFAANATRTLTALRHLVEYCALRAKGREVALTAALCANGEAAINQQKNGLVINRRWSTKRAAVVFSVQADIGTPELEQIRQDLRRCSGDPRVGNLLIVGAVIVDEHLTFCVSPGVKGVSTFALHLPATS